MTSPFVTEEVIQNFIRDGFVVIPDVFSPQEVQSFRDSLHASIAVHGIRHGDMSSDEYQRLSRFGPHSQIFYPPWKLAVQVAMSFRIKKSLFILSTHRRILACLE